MSGSSEYLLLFKLLSKRPNIFESATSLYLRSTNPLRLSNLVIVSREKISKTPDTQNWSRIIESLLTVPPNLPPGNFPQFYKYLLTSGICDLILSDNFNNAAEIAFDYLQTAPSNRRGVALSINGLKFFLGKFLEDGSDFDSGISSYQEVEIVCIMSYGSLPLFHQKIREKANLSLLKLESIQ